MSKTDWEPDYPPEYDEPENNQPQGCADCGEPNRCDCNEPKDGWLTEDGEFFIGDRRVRVGEQIVDFRGDVETYRGVAQLPSPGKSGKVRVGGKDEMRQGIYYPHCFVAVRKTVKGLQLQRGRQ